MGADLVGSSMLEAPKSLTDILVLTTFSRQMRGRAGRKGKDEIGETYLCCQKGDLEAVAELMEAEISSVGSGLLPEK